jgi:hypothetical protein
MANVTIPDLTSLSANVADGDLFEIADISNGNATRKVTRLEIIGLGSTGITTLGTITTGVWTGTTIAVANGGTGLTTGTSGGVLAFTAAGTIASSAALAANALVIGGGAGVAPSTTTTGTGVLTALGVNTNAGGGLIALADPGADRIVFWDDSAGAYTFLTVGTGLDLTNTTLTATGGSFDQAGNYTLTGTWDFSGAAGVTFGTVSITTINATSIVFEGATPDAFETTLGVTDPTADRTINLPNASGDVVITSSGVLLSNITLGESAGQIVLDPTLSADGTWSGIMMAGTAGATLAFGDLVYLAAADSRWELADADAASTSGDVILGICVLAAASDGDPTNILLQGKIRADTAFPALTIGAPVYVGTTPGDIQVAQPSGTDDVIRVCGHAQTADVLVFNPSGSFITHT